MNKSEIRKKRDETFDALKEIEFVIIGFSVFENAPKSGFQDFDNAMRYQMARQASEAELGLDVINGSIVENGILEKNRVEIKLQGKAKLELNTEKIRHQSKGSIQIDRVRYGLISAAFVVFTFLFVYAITFLYAEIAHPIPIAFNDYLIPTAFNDYLIT